MENSPAPLPSSFRDPSGFVYRGGDGVLYRQVNPSYATTYRALVESGLLARLHEDGHLISHDEMSLDFAATDDAAFVLRPKPVPFVSYPYEWSFGQLKDAALLTLDIAEIAFLHGMTLKDASAYNVQFRGTAPVFIDTLSFEPYEEGAPWIAYGQFCRHFLLPLALMAYRDVRMNDLLALHLDGIPLDLGAKLMPFRTRAKGGLLLHVHLHARTGRRATASSSRPAGRLSRAGFRGLLDSLRGTISRLQHTPSRSTWSDYYADAPYTGEEEKEKAETVDAMLRDVAPSVVWDLGANTGRYSEIAAATGATVVAMESDAECVEAAYRRWSNEGTPILPLRMDLTNPSAGLGWGNTERDSLAARGPADAILALALIHHLAIGNNVPFEKLAAYFHSIGRNAIVEFVPKSDPMVARLLSTRDDIFSDYTAAAFDAAFARH